MVEVNGAVLYGGSGIGQRVNVSGSIGFGARKLAEMQQLAITSVLLLECTTLPRKPVSPDCDLVYKVYLDSQACMAVVVGDSRRQRRARRRTAGSRGWSSALSAGDAASRCNGGQASPAADHPCPAATPNATRQRALGHTCRYPINDIAHEETTSRHPLLKEFLQMLIRPSHSGSPPSSSQSQSHHPHPPDSPQAKASSPRPARPQSHNTQNAPT